MKKLLALCALISVLLLTACGQPAPPSTQPEEPAPPAQEEAASPEEPAIPAVVTVDYAGEELLAKTDSYEAYVDDESEYRVQAVFTANVAVQDFHYLALGFEERDGNICSTVEGELYTLAQLSPERPAVISLALTGAIPDRGISYVDETGATRTFALAMSGKDGSLLLTEFS